MAGVLWREGLARPRPGGVLGVVVAVVFGLLLVPVAARAASSHTAYVATGNSVTPIDTATNTPGAPVTVGTHPNAIAITPDGRTAYVVNGGSGPGSGSVTPIDTATNTAGAAIPTGDLPVGIAITPDGKTAYVTNRNSDSVTPIDTATNTAGAAITVGSSATGIAITPDGKTAYVTISGAVTPIDTATNTAGAAIPITASNPIAIAITPDGTTAYVVNHSSSVTPIDTATNTAELPIQVGANPSGIAITPDGKTAYVTSGAWRAVWLIDTATNTAGTDIPVGDQPEGVAVTPDQGPVASFSVTPAAAGQASSFDASGSTDPDGTVASYRWDFGDGQSAITSTPTTTHTYAAGGSYTVTLTVSDDAGCSTGRVFTGQTVSCNGSAAAQIAHPVTVPALPTVSIATPAAGARYTRGQLVHSSFACSEGAGGPGIGSCLDQSGQGSGGLVNTATAGQHTFTVTARSGDGLSATASVTYTVTVKAPRLSRLQVRPHSFHAAPGGKTIIARVQNGATITYRDTRAAHTSLRVYRELAGVKHGHACLAPPKTNHRGSHPRPCVRLVLIGSFSHQDHAGTNRLRFTGRLHGRTLRHGNYKLTATARIAAQHSRTISTTFAILAPPPPCQDPDHDGDCDAPNQI